MKTNRQILLTSILVALSFALLSLAQSRPASSESKSIVEGSVDSLFLGVPENSVEEYKANGGPTYITTGPGGRDWFFPDVKLNTAENSQSLQQQSYTWWVTFFQIFSAAPYGDVTYLFLPVEEEDTQNQ